MSHHLKRTGPDRYACRCCGHAILGEPDATDFARGERATSQWTYDRIRGSRGKIYPQIARALAGEMLTDEELLGQTSSSANGLRARRSEMQQAGLIERIEGQERLTLAGHAADLWQLTALGWRYWSEVTSR